MGGENEAPLELAAEGKCKMPLTRLQVSLWVDMVLAVRRRRSKHSRKGTFG